VNGDWCNVRFLSNEQDEQNELFAYPELPALSFISTHRRYSVALCGGVRLTNFGSRCKTHHCSV